MFGGHSGNKHLNDLFVFDTSNLNWSELITSGNIPSGIRGHTANIIS